MKLPLNQEVSSKICYNHEKSLTKVEKTRPIGVVHKGPTMITGENLWRAN